MNGKYIVILYISLLFFNILYCQNGIKRMDGTVLTTDQIDSIVLRLMDTAKVKGLGLSIINNNKAVYTKAYGSKNTKDAMDASTSLYGASFSKSIFACIVMQLIQEKIMDLDKPLFTYLPKPLTHYSNYSYLKYDSRYKIITARMCLSHTSGLYNAGTSKMAKFKIFFEPGSKYAYSNEGIKLLQFVMEQLLNKDLETIAKERIFLPLEMQRTSYIWQTAFDQNYAVGFDERGRALAKKKRTTPNAAGSIETTITDYSKFITAVMQGKLLNETVQVEMLSPQIRIKSKYQFPPFSDSITNQNDAIELSYGLGWGIFKANGSNAFFKEGHDEGWEHYHVSFTKKETGIIIMTNSSNGEAIFKELLEKIIGDVYTPWQWERYIPYNFKQN